ncbi:GGDEF domain-containing protein [Psychromonas sp. MME2]|uniref:GGDEF domain-containing protein n=1 Tax=unclassified Psychromonas TaxID=2614957 RepID=UPI00339C61DE
MEATTQDKIQTLPLSDKIFTVFSNDTLLKPEDKLLSIELLQESFQLKELMNNFATLVARFVRPFNIRFQSAHGFFSIKLEKKFNYSHTFNLSRTENGERIGAITYQSSKPLGTKESKILTELHILLVPNLRYVLKISELNAMIFKDHLTNVGNRAYYDEAILRAIDQSNRCEQDLSIIVLDINDFKIINDTLGHLKGDQVLQHFAVVLTKSVRTTDMVFRLGGDEFVIILQPGEQQSVNIVTRRLFKEINQNHLLREINFSCAVGFSHWQMGQTADQLFAIADQNLYVNKLSRKKALN